MKRTRSNNGTIHNRAKALGLLLGLAWAAAPTVLGHASLTRIVPPPNARLETLPPRVELHFNEAIEPIFNGLQVLNRNGFPVHQGEASLSRNRREMTVALAPDLPDGIYTVSWKATSSDGHQIGGNFGFSVGVDFEASALVGEEAESGPGWPSPGMAAVRWIYFLSLMVFVGGFSFAAVVLPPLIAAPPVEIPGEIWARIRRGFLPVFLWSWVILFGTAVLNLIFKASAMAGVGMMEASGWNILRVVLSASQYGRMWTVGLGALLLGGVLFFFYRRQWPADAAPGRGTAALSLGLLATVILSYSVSNSGHAAAVTEWRWVALGSDIIHLLGTAFWVGGLIYLVLLIRSLSDTEAGKRARLMGVVVPRFSRMAQFSVAAILLSGAYTTWIHMPSWSAFLSTWYGRALGVKILLVLPLLVIGAVNLRVIKPELARSLTGKGGQALEGAVRALQRFRPLVQAEVALGVVILLVVVVLTNLSPAAEARAPGLTQLRAPSGMNVGLHIAPNQVGHNKVHVTASGADGTQLENLESVLLDVKLTDIDMQAERLEAERLEGGIFEAEAVLGMPGIWQITVRILEEGSSEQRVAVFENYLP